MRRDELQVVGTGASLQSSSSKPQTGATLCSCIALTGLQSIVGPVASSALLPICILPCKKRCRCIS